jgi:hypothetical protein
MRRLPDPSIERNSRRFMLKICPEPRVGGESGSSMAAFAKSWRRE